MVLSLTIADSDQTPLPSEKKSHISSKNETLIDLIQQQTDSVKRIVSHHQTQYPVVTKYPNNKLKQESETFENLKIRCQQLARLNAPPRVENKTGFYITAEPTPTKTTTGTPITITSTSTTTATPKPKPPQNIKYIKLEPVILQKTILSDGRTIYYWHKSLPSHIAPPSTTPQPITTPAPTPLPQQQPSANYNFRNFFPSFYPVGSVESTSTTTTEKTTTTTEIEKPDEMYYQHQLRFVVPVPYAPPDDPGVKKPYDFDQFAYYPKQLQPETINMQIPYVPTFHIIKAVAVPNHFKTE